MKIILYTFCAIAIFITGCEIRGYQSFIDACDDMVGCSIGLSYYDPVRIEPFNEELIAYHYESEYTGCKFIYYVNKDTDIVESWEFVSSPDNCYLVYQGY